MFLKVARCIEHAIAVQLARQVKAYQAIFPTEAVAVHPIAGGIAAITTAKLGSTLNRVSGIGMHSAVSDQQFRFIEALYSSIGLSTTIRLYPYTDKETVKTVVSRTYEVTGLISTYIRQLHHSGIHNMIREEMANTGANTNVVLSSAQARDNDLFIKCFVNGFQDGSRSLECLVSLAQIAIYRPDTSLFLVYVEGQVAGSGALSLVETACGLVGYLHHASILPHYRNRGLHQALYRARLVHAYKHGCSLALLEAVADSPSGRNAERMGFQKAYTKLVLQK